MKLYYSHRDRERRGDMEFEDMQYMDVVGNWIDIDKHFFQLNTDETKKSDKELELERLAEELGYNLNKEIR
jgi:hypothetical protein